MLLVCAFTSWSVSIFKNKGLYSFKTLLAQWTILIHMVRTFCKIQLSNVSTMSAGFFEFHNPLNSSIFLSTLSKPKYPYLTLNTFILLLITGPSTGYGVINRLICSTRCATNVSTATCNYYIFLTRVLPSRFPRRIYY